MKNIRNFCFCAVVLGCVLYVCACGQFSQVQKQPAEDFFAENPVTITWQSGAEKDIESFQADVSVYTNTNRAGTGTSLQNKYRMSLKTVNDVPYVRLDFDPEYNGGLFRSAISDTAETIIVDTVSEEIEYRIPVQDDYSADLAFLGTETAVSRVNLSLIKTEARRLAFDMTDEQGSALIVSIPNDFFADPYKTRLSTRVTFDTVNETLNQVEIVTVLQDGTNVTTTTYPMYEEKNGEPVKIGSVTVIDSKAPGLLAEFEDAEYFDSIADIPEISDAEYQRLLDSGEITEVEAMPFGNPADMSYQETIIEVYNDIEINTVTDNPFRLLLKE
ncbi:hypothetical protein [Treponema brennaborense]|uniref:Lipoprotein n=1 Tax=Treponema brennaborense (strain DSM 12168 / CIP 105900 / DD5/3) TaxID=906968 RepID=F4LJP4_TREBD|nr:hypothetical protein [Treponema brennaborense]AEE17424.1 hypothetical protein Trebr_2009 [Treponema brennaborense DSM 12168]